MVVKRDEKVETDVWHRLVGKWFHILNDGVIEKQGQIIGCPQTGWYVVQFYQWLTGSTGWGNVLVSLETIERQGWLLYATNEEMRESYEYSGKAARDNAVPVGPR